MIELAFLRLVRALAQQDARYVLIGVAGINLFARSASTVFTTADRDLFIPPDSANCMAVWRACDQLDLALSCGQDPLDRPRDRWLADQIVARRALVRATDGSGLDVDLTMVMAGFDFESVERSQRVFVVDGVEIPVARLSNIISSKALADRPKDRMFLTAHEEALSQLRDLDE